MFEIVVAESKAIHGARGEVLYYYINFFYQVSENLFSFVCAEIHCNRSLTSIYRKEITRFSINHR